MLNTSHLIADPFHLEAAGIESVHTRGLLMDQAAGVEAGAPAPTDS